MNHELFTNMQKQMNPSPDVRAALSEKLARPAKKRPAPWMKYGALAACAALVIGGFLALGPLQKPTVYVSSFVRDTIIDTPKPLHSYVTVEGLMGYATEDAAVHDTGTGGTEVNTGDLPNRDDAPSGALPGGAYIGDAPVQEEAFQAQDKLFPHVKSNPDWYGGMYIDNTGTLVVCLVESEDPGDKSLELQVLEWTGSDRVAFTDVKYSLAYLDELMDRLNHLPEDPKCYNVMASWARDEMNNRVVVTLTEANDYILSILAELDPDDDAIYVQVGQRASVEDYSGDKETPSVHYAVPGGTTAPVPEDDDLIADEPYYDGARYGVENLPEELPQEKQPAFVETNPVPERDAG